MINVKKNGPHPFISPPSYYDHVRHLSFLQMSFFDCYTPGMACCLRIRYFFRYLQESCVEGSPNYVLARSFNFADTMPATVRDVREHFAPEVTEDCLFRATEQCLTLAERRCSSDPTLKTCVVCFDNGANYYVVHGDQAHKSVCAKCAMSLSLRTKPVCPMSRASISHFMVAPKDRIECVCKESDCFLHVLAKPVRKLNAYNFQTASECHTCTLESLSIGQDLRVFDVYSVSD